MSTSAAALLLQYTATRSMTPRAERDYASIVRVFSKWYGTEPTIGDLASKASEYIRCRAHGNGFTANCRTAAKHRAVLRCLLRFAKRQGHIEKVLLCKVRMVEHVPSAFTAKELTRLRQHASPIVSAGIDLAYDTGLRRSDIMSLTWNSVTKAAVGYNVAIVQAKTGRRIVKPLRTETYRKLHALKVDDRLLPVTRDEWCWHWHKCGKAAKVNTHKRGLQAIRRAGASYVDKAGGSAQDYLGHRTAGLAKSFYIDPKISPHTAPLPPAFCESPDATA